MKAYLNKKLASIGNALGLNYLNQQILELKLLNAKNCINQMQMLPAVNDLADTEYKVFSQFGDDGILQYIIHHLNIPKSTRTFVEFGVENYEESNTRFLLMNNNWRGLIMDGSESHMKYVQNSKYYWKYDLTAKPAFINTDNINDLISSAGFNGEIGLLSVDIDGNDYWVWDTINVINPIFVIAEYNGIFGWEHALSVPYDPTFIRTDAHYSNLYWGCSLAALNHLAEKKGYIFAGCNSAGNNAYFIRADHMNEFIPQPTLEAGFYNPKFKESRNKNGELTFLKGNDRLKAIGSLPLVDVRTGKSNLINELFEI